MNNNQLTIIIPTYNRKERLKKLLKSFEADNKKYEEYKIIILNNDSNYDVSQMLKDNFNKLFLEKIVVINNKINIGMIGNVSNCLNIIDRGWVWLISDDDEITENAINTVQNTVQKNSEISFIKFSTEGIGESGEEKDMIVESLECLIDYYYKKTRGSSGNLVFMSNNLFHIELLSEFIKFAYDYSYTQVPHIIPILMGLNARKIKIKFSSEKVIKYIPPDGDHWNVSKIALGASTFSHLPLNLSKDYRKKYLEIIMWINYRWCLLSLIKNQEKNSKKIFNQLYTNIYKEYLPFKDRIIAKTFCLILGEKSNNILLKSIEILKKFRRN